LRELRVAAVSLATVLAPGPTWSQPTTPVLQIQPGFLSADFVSAPDALNSTSGFNLRFATRIPTGLPWLTPVVGGSVTPYGTTGPSTRNTNAPAIFGGNIFPLLGAARTRGWLTIELPLLIYHAYGGGSANNSRIYGRDLFIQVAGYLHVGSKLLGELGSGWVRLDGYAFLEQNLTPNEDGSTGRTDRFNPVMVFGASLSLGSSEGRRP
jgi:hypothetical protein